MCGSCGSGLHGSVSDVFAYDHPQAEDGKEEAVDAVEGAPLQQHMQPTSDLASPHPQELLRPSFQPPYYSQL